MPEKNSIVVSKKGTELVDRASQSRNLREVLERISTNYAKGAVTQIRLHYDIGRDICELIGFRRQDNGEPVSDPRLSYTKYGEQNMISIAKALGMSQASIYTHRRFYQNISPAQVDQMVEAVRSNGRLLFPWTIISEISSINSDTDRARIVKAVISKKLPPKKTSIMLRKLKDEKGVRVRNPRGKPIKVEDAVEAFSRFREVVKTLKGRMRLLTIGMSHLVELDPRQDAAVLKEGKQELKAAAADITSLTDILYEFGEEIERVLKGLE